MNPLTLNSDLPVAGYPDSVVEWSQPDGPICPWSWQAVHRPQGVAVIDGSGQVETWLSLHERAARWENKCASMPAGPIVVSTWNSAALVAFLIGAWRASRVVAVVSPRLPEGTAESLTKTLSGSLVEVDSVDETDLVSPASPASPALCSLGGAATLILTSGSTGDARFVRHSVGAHKHSAIASGKRLRISESDRWLWSLPAFHAGGMAILWRMAVYGGSVMIQPRGRTLADQLTRKSPTMMSLVPTQLRDLLDSNTLRPTALRDVVVGGAPLSMSLLKLAVTAKWPIRTTYGLSETASMMTLSERWTSANLIDIPGELVPNGPSPAGYPLDGAQIEIKEGRVRVKGPMLAEAYLDITPNVHDAPVAGHEGWLSTSDAGELLQDGQLRISHRLDRVIISGGENVDLARIEMAIRQLMGVYQAAVIGVPDARYGERPVAFVDMHGTLPDADWFKDQLRSRLENMAIPDRFLLWPAELDGSIKPSHTQLRRLAIQAGQ